MQSVSSPQTNEISKWGHMRNHQRRSGMSNVTVYCSKSILAILITMLIVTTNTTAFSPFSSIKISSYSDKRQSTYIPTISHQHWNGVHKKEHNQRQRLPSASISLNVFERMSEEGISAIVTAQRLTNQYQLEFVDRQAMLAGCVDQPENRAVERTFQQYRISWRLIDKTFKELQLAEEESKPQQTAVGWLSGFRAAKATDGDNDRPFSKELRATLAEAGRIATQMKSPTVSVHHIVLALFEYKEVGKDGTPTAYDAVYNTDPGSPWYLIKKMNAVDDDVTPLKICQTLLNNIQNADLLNEVIDGDKRELVAGKGGSSGTSKTPTLNDFGTDLTQLASDGLLDPVFGRENEIRSCVRTLIRRRKNNVCLIGEPGVGKTAIAEGVAQILVDEAKCPKPLAGHRLVSLELSSLVAGTKYRGEFEERLQSIVTEVTNPKSPPTILFIDEIHNLVGAGSASEGGTMDAANILKPALARGQMQIIGATTIAEYRKYIEKDAALERRLQPIMVREPTVLQTIEILKAVQTSYERHHNVRYTPDALIAAAQLSERYISDRFLPDKALDLLDESGAITQLEYLENQISLSGDENEDILINDDSNMIPVVTEQTVAEVMSEWSGIPIGKLEASEMDRLMYLENELSARVKGQSRAIRGVARAIRRARSGLRDPKRPVASFLFCGPTGTGKTELCKTLAETYYGAEKDMIRIDMSEYMEKHTTSRLTGPPPGYIGYEAGGQLTEAVRRSPHSVVLLDEIEKAHEDVLNILLQIMEDGILTDGKGRTVNFKNTVIVMTSNVGSRRILEVVRGNKRENTLDDDDEFVDPVADTIKALNVRSESSITAPVKEPAPSLVVEAISATSTSKIHPLKPEEVLKKMQENPKAATIMMKAASDPEIMNAVRIAMNDSPAALLQEAQKNPTIAKFLQDVWYALEGEDQLSKTAPPTQSPPQSGLDTIRKSFQETISQWNDVTSSEFATGVIDQLKTAETTGTTAIEDETEDENFDDLVDHILYPELISVVKEELEAAMKPEFLNRIDEIVVFSPLSPANLVNIAKLTIEKIVKRAATEHAMEELTVEPSLIEKVRNEGSANAEQFGARPMRRAAQRYIEDSLSDAIISGFFNLEDGRKESKVSLALGPPHIDGRDRVVIKRLSDGKVIEIKVEDASGGIGAVPRQVKPKRFIELAQVNGGQGPMLQTEPVP